MQTDFLERLDAISQESRERLNERIEHIQREARKLRSQARRLRRAQRAEKKQRKRLLEQIAQTGKTWGQRILNRGEEPGSPLRAGQQALLERSSRVTQNLAEWGDETAHRLRQQGKHLTQDAAEWGDETVHRLRRQGQQLVGNAAEWGDETAHQLRRKGQHLVQNLQEGRAETVRTLRRQGRSVGRGLAQQREEMARQLRRQGRVLGRNVTERREDVSRRLRKQRDRLHAPGSKHSGPAWSIFGFVAGLLLAGGMTYWLVRRGLGKRRASKQEQIGLPQRETLNGSSTRSGDVRYSRQGSTAVATRLGATSVEPATRFVGVLGTRRYYPLERQPEAGDLVFFVSEADAVAEGFTAAE
jgi:hypothetical protein